MYKFFKYYSKLKKLFFLLIIVTAITLIYAYFIEPKRLVVKDITISSNKIDSEINLVILSDIHAPINKTLFNKLISTINSIECRAILIAGDINAHLIPRTPSIQFINRLYEETKKPIYLILGDSDICSQSGQCIYCQKHYRSPKVAIHATILRDSTLTLFSNLSLSGLDYSRDDNWEKPDFHNSIDDSLFKILLLHNTVDISKDYLKNYDLSISGNTHGGQVIFSANFLSIFDDDLDGRFIKGHYKTDDKDLLVSSGIGMSFLPIRFGVPPELIHLKLRSKK